MYHEMAGPPTFREDPAIMTFKFNSIDLAVDLTDKLIQFMNCKILRGNALVEDDHLWVHNGKIISGESVFFEYRRKADVQIDCEGNIISAGFIDVQLNGGFGVDFSSITSDNEYKDGIQKVAKLLLSHGVTAFAPTVITSPAEIYQKVLPLLSRREGSEHGAAILGAHLEGPFIAQKKKGCHPAKNIANLGDHPETTLKEVYGSFDNIAIVTLAPEVEGSEKAIRILTESNVVVSLGHSMSGLADGERGIVAGASCITHLFNAMQSYHHRDPGLIGLLASKVPQNSNRTLFYGIIADGIHTDDSALRIAYRTYPEGLLLVTDAITALGMEDGRHQFGDQIINVKGMSATLDGTETAAGSVAPMPYCVRHFMKAARCSLEEALVCATQKPAKMLSLKSKGSLDVGNDADLVILTQNVDVLATFIGGRLVFTQC